MQKGLVVFDHQHACHENLFTLQTHCDHEVILGLQHDITAGLNVAAWCDHDTFLATVIIGLQHNIPHYVYCECTRIPKSL